MEGQRATASQDTKCDDGSGMGWAFSFLWAHSCIRQEKGERSCRCVLRMVATVQLDLQDVQHGKGTLEAVLLGAVFSRM